MTPSYILYQERCNGAAAAYAVSNKIQADIFKIKEAAGKTKEGEEDSRLRVQYQLAL